MMLTKTLQFDEDVLTVIRAMDWRDDGKLGVLTGGQLERQLYVRVSTALEAMGGKWNRKQGGHVFVLDPRPRVEGLVESGMLTVERDGFFETPLAVVQRMLELVTPHGNMLEPEAGLGAIANHLPRENLLCIEKNEQRAEALRQKGYLVFCCDFLDYCTQEHGMFNTIYMNPPFEEGQDILHVCHAYECLAEGGAIVAIMSEGSFFRQDDRAADFRTWLYHVNGISEKLSPDAFKESGTGVHARLVVIRK